MIDTCLFVTATHQTGLDTRPMTKGRLYSGLREGGDRARGETRTLLDYVGHNRSPESGPTEAMIDVSITQQGLKKWRWPWCNGYRSRKWTQRHEFKTWTRLIAFHIALIPLGKV